MSDSVKRNALKIVKRLHDAGFKAYIVGGAVRDMVMGIEPGDYDIATDASTSDVAKLFRHVIFVGEVLLAHVNPDAPGRIYIVGKGYKMSGVSSKIEF